MDIEFLSTQDFSGVEVVTTAVHPALPTDRAGRLLTEPVRDASKPKNVAAWQHREWLVVAIDCFGDGKTLATDATIHGEVDVGKDMTFGVEVRRPIGCVAVQE